MLLRVGTRSYPVLLPKLSDPRLHLAGVIFSLQALGQTVLGFDLSIAQILVSLGTCAVIEVSLAFWQRRVIMWPASGLLTGNGVAFILRVPGTNHGEWWSMRGAHIFIAVAAISVLSKHVVQFKGRHLFNPSNIGLVLCFLILGSRYADPQDLWWGPLSPGLAAALAVIFVGGAVVTARQHLLPVALAFFVTFTSGAAILAARDHCVSARWKVGPVCGGSYWWVLVSSPEILVFLFFMITDPRTIPLGRVGRVVHGAAVGVVAVLLIAPQTTEFATKVAILTALVIVCAFRPLLDRLAPAAGSARDGLRSVLRTSRAGTPALVRRSLVVGGGAGLFAVAVLAVGLTAGRPVTPSVIVSTGALADRPKLDIETGAVPKVTIDASATRVQPPLRDATAQQMGHDLVESLRIESDAIRQSDFHLLATAVTSPRLDADRTAMSGTARGTAGDEFHFERMAVVLLRDPARPQAPPTLGIKSQGTVRRKSTGSPVPFAASFVLVDGGGTFLVADELAR